MSENENNQPVEVKHDETGAIKKEEVNINGLAEIHAGNAEKIGVIEEESVKNALAETHSTNPKSDAVVTNALNNDPNDVTNKGVDDNELPTHLGGIKLETENEE